MSLFDVLRYPISDIPTIEQIDAIPIALFERWKIQCDWRKGVDRCTIVNYYEHVSKDRSYKDINQLRKMIKEYDEPL